MVVMVGMTETMATMATRKTDSALEMSKITRLNLKTTTMIDFTFMFLDLNAFCITVIFSFSLLEKLNKKYYLFVFSCLVLSHYLAHSSKYKNLCGLSIKNCYSNPSLVVV